MIQRAPAAPGGGFTVPDTALRDLRPSRPLEAVARSYFEPRFGRGFGNVRIHTGSEANRLAHQIQARAFTIGRDVVFGAGEYAPATTRGRRLLAHELTT